MSPPSSASSTATTSLPSSTSSPVSNRSSPTRSSASSSPRSICSTTHHESSPRLRVRKNLDSARRKILVDPGEKLRMSEGRMEDIPLQDSSALPKETKKDDDDVNSKKVRTQEYGRLCWNLQRMNSSMVIWSILNFSYRFRRILLPIFIILIIHIRCNLRRSYRRYFGAHPTHGGRLGVELDNKISQYVIDETYKRKEQELQDVGVVLPRPHRITPDDLLQINTNAALRELLIRRETRARVLSDLEDAAAFYQQTCFMRPSLRSNTMEMPKGIPPIALVPDLVEWAPPRPLATQSLTTLTFDQREMRELLQDDERVQTLIPTYQSLSNTKDRVYLWAICALYLYGGVFVGPDSSVDVDQWLNGLYVKSNSTHCVQPLGMAVFTKSSSSLDLALMAATPRHPHLLCLLLELSGKHGLDASNLLSSFFLGSFESSYTFQGHKQSLEVLTTHCQHEDACCHSVDLAQLSYNTPIQLQDLIDSQNQFYIQVASETPPPQRLGPTTVDVREREGTVTPVKSHKFPLETQMRLRRAEPGWLCSRCLKTPLFGTLDTCASVCPSGYEDILCREADEPSRQKITVDVTVHNAGRRPGEKRIPRIVHQTWFEELSLDRYPQLARLQNSWKNSGWDYRFYTDETAREYIVKHFPQRFVDAFDALIPGAYKADLFRYLVLMKDGGVYADVDIMLDTTLDTFVTPDLSFFAPRDVVGEYADEPFCLWNGMIGAAPGHPFIVRAVERLINLILERADLYDMERDVCRRAGRSMEVWKVRAEPLLLFSGPCALGVAVNDVLNRTSLSRLEIGWIGLDNVDYYDRHDHGDALILVGDKYDIGAFRISDPERNFVVASTDMQGVDKVARETSHATRSERRKRLVRRPALPHYSEAAKGVFVWGVQNVYHDDYVNNEEIEFDVQYNEG